jgi:hypothetical protein
MYFVSIYENRRTKPVEIVLRRGWRRSRRTMEGTKYMQPRYILNTYVNITIHSPVQLFYVNKIIKKVNRI